MRMRPVQKQLPFLPEDGKVVNEMMLRISLNPARKHVLYHCVSASPFIAGEMPFLDKIGMASTTVSYGKFKSACLRLGAKSPLHHYWLLLDVFQNYWFAGQEITTSPIDMTSVHDDCSSLPRVTPLMTLFRNSLSWMLCHPDDLHFDCGILRASLDFQSILLPAQKLCKNHGIDFDAVVPPFAREGLRRICEEVTHRVNDVAVLPAIAFQLTSALEARVSLYRLLAMHPEIMNEPIEQPVFILGLNRTGTTFLHRMLEASGLFQAPHVEDQTNLPSAEELCQPGALTEKERISFLDCNLQEDSDQFAGIHDISTGIAEEDMCAHAHCFASSMYDILYDLPEYRRWLEQQNLDEVYVEHKRWMQFISWSRRRANKPLLRWCFKMPWHVRSLSSLFKAYPDALLVHTHRDPEKVAGSFCSLVEGQRERFVEVDRTKLGLEQVESIENTLALAMQFRADHPELKNRWLDVQFMDLMTSPKRVAARVVAHAGLPINKQATNLVSDYVEESIRRRGSMKLHKYDIQDYGIKPSAFDTNVFREYKSDWLEAPVTISRCFSVLSCWQR
eukprot:scaffold1586_cov158-Amphora_coffeaeformis.AAC.4